jgi:hypothetical protein
MSPNRQWRRQFVRLSIKGFISISDPSIGYMCDARRNIEVTRHLQEVGKGKRLLWVITDLSTSYQLNQRLGLGLCSLEAVLYPYRVSFNTRYERSTTCIHLKRSKSFQIFLGHCILVSHLHYKPLISYICCIPYSRLMTVERASSIGVQLKVSSCCAFLSIRTIPELAPCAKFAQCN